MTASHSFIISDAVLDGSALGDMVDQVTELLTEGGGQQRSLVPFVGAQLTTVIWEPEDATMDFARFGGHPFDQVILVLNGEMTVTETTGENRRYGTGDLYVLPQGFRGVCRWRDRYRHLYVATTAQVNALMGMQTQGQSLRYG